jgi:hypothetical protein
MLAGGGAGVFAACGFAGVGGEARCISFMQSIRELHTTSPDFVSGVGTIGVGGGGVGSVGGGVGGAVQAGVGGGVGELVWMSSQKWKPP